MTPEPSNISTAPSPVGQVRTMSRVALGLSIVAFLVPLGIISVFLGHAAEKRISWGDGTESDSTVARAALWIAYLQLALVAVTLLFGWSLFHETVEGFRHDPMVQRLFHPSDEQQTLNADSAREAEETALNTTYQLIAIEEQIRRHRDDGGYACRVDELIQTGPEGSTEAERRAFTARVLALPYMFRISNCNPAKGGMTSAAFVLTVVPHPPQMPAKSAIYCTDQTGVVLQSRGETSLDCLKTGEAVRP
jgi:hypothetical protein